VLIQEILITIGRIRVRIMREKVSKSLENSTLPFAFGCSLDVTPARQCVPRVPRVHTRVRLRTCDTSTGSQQSRGRHNGNIVTSWWKLCRDLQLGEISEGTEPREIYYGRFFWYKLRVARKDEWN